MNRLNTLLAFIIISLLLGKLLNATDLGQWEKDIETGAYGDFQSLDDWERDVDNGVYDDPISNEEVVVPNTSSQYEEAVKLLMDDPEIRRIMKEFKQVMGYDLNIEALARGDNSQLEAYMAKMSSQQGETEMTEVTTGETAYLDILHSLIMEGLMDKKNPLTLAVEALGLDFVRGSENPEDYPETFKTLIAIGDLKKSMNSKLSSLGMGFLDMNDGYILNDLQYVAEDTLDPEVFELFMDSRPLNAEALRVLVEGE